MRNSEVWLFAQVYETENPLYLKKWVPAAMEISEIQDIRTANLNFPAGFSFFQAFLQYFTQEILEVGGEAHVSRTSGGMISGLFLYDPDESAASIYTKSREIFDIFYGLKPVKYVFAEIKTEIENYPYDIYSIDLKNYSIDHNFNHQISLAETDATEELERFMSLTHPGINRRWVRVALKNGDKCFTVRLNDEIAGVGWLSVANGVGRLHSLYVKPQFRKMRIGEDILNARLLWAKSKNVHLVFSEIAQSNFSCLRVAAKGNMKVSGQVYQYFKKNPETKMGK